MRERQTGSGNVGRGCADVLAQHAAPLHGGGKGSIAPSWGAAMLHPYRGSLLRLAGDYNVGRHEGSISFPDNCVRRQIVGEQTAELAALIEVHVYDLEGHALAAVVAEQSRSLEMAQTELHLQLHRRARRQVAIDSGNAAGKAHRANFHTAILFEVDAEGHYGLLQADTSMPALAHKFVVDGHFERSQREIPFAQAALGEKFPRPYWVQLLKRLQGGDAQLLRMSPAEDFLGLDDAFQRGD